MEITLSVSLVPPPREKLIKNFGVSTNYYPREATPMTSWSARERASHYGSAAVVMRNFAIVIY